MSRFKDESWEAKQYFGEVQIKVIDKKGAEGRRVGFSRNMDDAIAISLMPDMYRLLSQISEFKKQVDDGVNVQGGMSGMIGSIDMIGELLAKARGE